MPKLPMMARWSVTDRTQALYQGRRAAVRWLRSGDGPSQAVATRDLIIWALALWFLCLDLFTTWYGIQLGFRESNQFAVLLLSQFGYVGLASVKAGALGIAVIGWWILPYSERFIAPSCLAIPWGLASLYNTVLIAGLV